MFSIVRGLLVRLTHLLLSFWLQEDMTGTASSSTTSGESADLVVYKVYLCEVVFSLLSLDNCHDLRLISNRLKRLFDARFWFLYLVIFWATLFLESCG